MFVLLSLIIYVIYVQIPPRCKAINSTALEIIFSDNSFRVTTGAIKVWPLVDKEANVWHIQKGSFVLTRTSYPVKSVVDLDNSALLLSGKEFGNIYVLVDVFERGLREKLMMYEKS
ncbi:MAG: hypothetical protein V4456_16200 [Bacteroidota bacterium]